MYKVEVRKSAEEHLDSIIDYIALESPTRAITFTREMITKFTSLVSTFPYAGVKYKQHYCFKYKGYLMFYQVQEEQKQVNLLFVLNSAQYMGYVDIVE